MSGTRFGRRTFLASSAGVAVAAVGAGVPGPEAVGAAASGGAGTGVQSMGREGVTAGPPGPLHAGGLTVNGLVEPVGVDPDGCSFAWTLHATGREVRQTGYRLRVTRTDPATGDGLGQRPGALGPPCLRRLRGSGARSRRLLRVDRAGAGPRRAVGAGIGCRAVHHRAA